MTLKKNHKTPSLSVVGMTDDQSDILAAAEFVMTADHRVGHVSTVFI